MSGGMRADLYRPAADAPSCVFEKYEKAKRAYKDTEAECAEAGLRFTPMVLEAHGGGYSNLLRDVLDDDCVFASFTHSQNH